ncbi:zinc ribbon domain-containing protein [Halobacillus sp. BBL2006]|uniref:zinc ribbon domain-containing protein n=1 Tax=Halobacillus sp. BBL2006 TaxID=1543706 RepID=UPI0012DFEE14|nr:zinc ribbon domain-containing protein [Halobacillus sp. BBL2006]
MIYNISGKERGSMYCSQCGALMKEDAKFCGGCGSQLGQESQQVPASTKAHQQQQQGTQMSAASVAAPKQDSEYVEKAKHTSRQFFYFALQSLKAPLAASKKSNEKDKVNGLIAHVLLAFLIPLFTYFTAKSVNTYGVVEVSFGSVVFQPFFYLLIYLAVFTAVTLGVAKLMKVEVSFLSVMSKYGALNVIPVSLLLLSNLLAILSMNAVSTFLFIVGIGLFMVSNFALLFAINAEKKTNQGIDVYYGLIISNVVMAIFFAIVGMTVVERIMDQLSNSPLGFFM